MKKEFVSYELAVKLKALGFDEPCFGYYSKSKLTIEIIKSGKIFTMGLEDSIYFEPDNSCLAPTFSQCFRWFREKGYDVKVVKESPGLYFGFYWTGAAWIMVGNGTYEASEQACLDKLIEIVEGKSL